MSRLIDADAILTDDYTHVLPNSAGKAAGRIIVFTDDIENAPTADAEPIRHGEWIYDLRYTSPKCSVCGKRIHSGDWSEECNFCGHCGAKMDIERKEK